MKMFLTVGAQMPFDRLVRAVDDWAEVNRHVDVHAQIGCGGMYVPHSLRTYARLSAGCFEKLIADADVLIGHAGMGTIITAMQFHKPLIVLPRAAALGETRNDHQFDTAHQFMARTPIAVAWQEAKLPALLDEHASLQPMPRIGSFASEALLEAVHEAIHPERSSLRHWLALRAAGKTKHAAAIAVEPKPHAAPLVQPASSPTSEEPIPIKSLQGEAPLRRAA